MLISQVLPTFNKIKKYLLSKLDLVLKRSMFYFLCEGELNFISCFFLYSSKVLNKIWITLWLLDYDLVICFLLLDYVDWIFNEIYSTVKLSFRVLIVIIFRWMLTSLCCIIISTFLLAFLPSDLVISLDSLLLI